MMLSPDIAGGAGDRLLPPSVPFRFFGMAVVFHVLAWAVLAGFAGEASGFLGGKGHVLAAIHFFTLGVLVTTAMGASYQFLPMATSRPVRSVLLSKVSFWLFIPGVLLFCAGIAHFWTPVSALGATLAAAGIAVFAVLLVENLRSAVTMPVVRLHAWVALASLLAAVLLGLILLADFESGFLPDHLAAAGVHVALAAYGFMGMLVLGFSTILVPMFVLGQAPADRLGRASTALAAVALVLCLAGGLLGSTALLVTAALAGLGAAGTHLKAMADVLKRRMRRNLDNAFILIGFGWAMLPVSLLLALATAAGWPGGPTGTLFGITVIGGWLLSVLFGVLQRIIPFLATVHAMPPGGRPPLVSALTPNRPLQVHTACHIGAVILLLLGQGLDAVPIIRLGALVGLAGAIAFASFAVIVLIRSRRHIRRLAPPKAS